MKAWRNLVKVSLAALLIACAVSSRLSAETLESALVKAYQDNPQLNAQRAQVRATDENVPQALSGYRPRVTVTATAAEQRGVITEGSPIPTGGIFYTTNGQTFTSSSYGVTASQILFNGFQTANRTRTAESQVQGAREALRVMEQTILLNAATIYMDVLRDAGAVEIEQSYVVALRKVLEQTNKRFSKGDVTVTDVAQAQAQLDAAEIALITAEYTLATAKANYQTIIGVPPQDLKPGAPVDRLLPKTLPAAIDIGVAQNPNVLGTMYGIDVASLQVKINEGALFPTLVAQASIQQANYPAVLVQSQYSASVLTQLTIPLYQGGGEFSLIRQSKETVGQQRLNLDLVRLQVRAAVTQTWSQVVAAKGALEKAKQEVTAAETAVNGYLKEILVGERTTLDLLITQQNLVNARNALIAAQHDRVVSTYGLLAAIGGLSPATLGLPTEIYDPRVHYQQVRDAWIGLRTP